MNAMKKNIYMHVVYTIIVKIAHTSMEIGPVFVLIGKKNCLIS